MKEKIYYRLIGEGDKPLVFIHGILGFWRNFYSISQAFKKDYTGLLYDQRGHGRSFHKEPYTVEQLAQDLKNLLEHLKWNKVTIVGHSLGAYVSILFSHNYPDYVEKIIIVDGSPWPQAHSVEQIRAILLHLPDSFSNRSAASDFFKQSIEKGIFSKSMADFLMVSLEKKSDGAINFVFDKKGLLKLLLNIREYYYPFLIKTLEIPILFLRGKNSKHFLLSDFKKTLQLNPFITGKEIKDSGHWLHADQPEPFIRALKKFLNYAN